MFISSIRKASRTDIPNCVTMDAPIEWKVAIIGPYHCNGNLVLEFLSNLSSPPFDLLKFYFNGECGFSSNTETVDNIP